MPFKCNPSNPRKLNNLTSLEKNINKLSKRSQYMDFLINLAH